MRSSYLSVAALYAAATGFMLAFRSALGLATVALVYILLVFLSAVWWGRGPSLAASILAFLSAILLFTPPYTTFFDLDVASQDVIGLAIFLVVAESTSRLVVRLREREAEARRQAWEVSTIHALSAVTSSSARLVEFLPAVAGRIVELLPVRECAIYLPNVGGRLVLQAVVPPRLEGSSESDPDALSEVFDRRESTTVNSSLLLPLDAGEKTVGVMGIRWREGAVISDATSWLLRTFANQVAAVVERFDLQRDAEEAEILRRTDELKSVLLSAVSHDLRTPLATIRMVATALLEEGVRWSDEHRREMLQLIDVEAARLSRLVGNLLEFSRIEAGVLHPVKEWHDLREVIARATDALHDRLREHRIEVDVPAGVALVPFDLTQIEDVLVNLLDNAVRFAPEGTPIRIAVRPWERAVQVQVENEGPAIPVEAAERVFTRFYTLHGPRRTTGLGLAICKGLVEAHGGRIWVDRPGEPGARFAFTLPLEEMPLPVGEEPRRT